MLLLGSGVFIFIIINRQKLKRFSSWKIIAASFYTFLGGILFTVLESFFLHELLNFLEHLFYMVSALLLAVWCHHFSRQESE
jgi:uncharacterized membrane protein YdcZ (DUF606 family)